jgi:hypothetical protein
MNTEPNLLLLVIGVLLVGGGFLLGLAVGRASSKAERRIRELEAEIEASRESFQRYRGDVSEHFGRTSELLRDLTLQYRAVYEHLADGARTLCPEKTDVLPAGGPENLLVGAAAAAAPGASALEVADANGAERAETADLGTAIAPVKEAVAGVLASRGNGEEDHVDDLDTDLLADEEPELETETRARH